MKCQQIPSEDSGVAPDFFWVQYIGCNRPQLICGLTCKNKTIRITSLLDTDADVTVISHLFWPKDWTLVAPLDPLAGMGGAIICLQSGCTIVVKDLKGRQQLFVPLLCRKPSQFEEETSYPNGEQSWKWIFDGGPLWHSAP